jgi:hypothetical protein
MVIDLHELIHYEVISEFFDFDLSKQEILEISKGDYGAICLTSQDYKIKYLPNNLVVYSKYDLTNPQYFLFQSPFALEYYSRINEKDIAEMYPPNTWVKYEDPDSYEYALWTENETDRESYLVSYLIENYHYTLENEKEISNDEILNLILFNYPELFFHINNSESLLAFYEPASDLIFELYTNENFKSRVRSEKIFDISSDAFQNIWIATGRRLIRINEQKYYEINIPAVVLENDNNNNLWIGTAAYNSAGSLIKFDGETFTTYNSYNSPLPENSGILALYCDDYSNLWISLKRKGFPYKLDNINIAIFNQSGLIRNKYNAIVSSISTVKKSLIQNHAYPYCNTNYVDYNIDRSMLSGKIEFMVGNYLINSFVVKEDHCKNSLSFDFDIYQPGKYPFKVFFIDSLGVKTEIMNVNLEMRFNEYGFFLGQNKPNPFSSYTKIDYGYFEGSMVEIKILDSFLRQVDSSIEYFLHWIGKPYLFESKDLPNGIYSYYLKENYSGIVDAKKMILFDTDKIIFPPH